MISSPSAHLLIGPSAALEGWLETSIAPLFRGDVPTHALRIKLGTHPLVVRLSAVGGGYKRADVETLSELCRYHRSPEEDPLCVVIERIEAMQSSTAHLLLKNLEELAPGHVVILTAASQTTLLPTIISRCIVHHLQHEHHREGPIEHLYQASTVGKGKGEPMTKLLEGVQDHHMTQVLDECIAYWVRQAAKEEDAARRARLQKLCRELAHFSALPSRAGSHKLLWKAVLTVISHYTP